MELTSLDVHYLARELSLFKGAKLEKVFQSGKDRKDVLLVLYLRDHPKLYLRLRLPGMICLQDEKPTYPQVPPPFAMFLRKHIGGARLRSVEQRGSDRVLTFTFETKTGVSDLAVEILAPGNIVYILDGKVKNLAEHQQFKDRKLRGGIEYMPPPASFDFISADESALIDIITTSTRESIVKTLAITVGLGGTYAEEVCTRAEIEKDRNDLKQDEVRHVAQTVRLLCNEKIVPHANDKRAFPFKMESVPCELSRDSFLLALGGFVAPPEDGKEQVQGDGRKKKAETMLKAQEKQLERIQKEAPENTRKGEVIFEQYQLVLDILNTVKEARKEKQDPADALKRFPQVKKYHKNTGEIEVELDE